MDTTKPKLGTLESLRGLLAVWVLGAHVAGRSLLDSDIRAAHLAAITEPLLPVYVFMTLSGFVIFYLLDREPQSYRTFLTRRFFRLVPLYLAVLGVVALSVSAQLHSLDSLPWQNRAVADSIKIHQETLNNFWPHLTAHVFLLHGLVPASWLPDSNFTFLSQGWSVSLEWQFYLLAPLVFLFIRRRLYLFLAALVVGLAIIQAAGIAGVGFLPNQLHYFVLGIASYYIFKSKLGIPGAGFLADLLLLAVCGVAFLAVQTAWPVIIWLVVLYLITLQQRGKQSPLSALALPFLEMASLQWLGRISYSVYLVHIPVLYAVFHFISHFAPQLRNWQFLAASLPITLIATIGISALTYRWIEQPGIAWGRHLSKLHQHHNRERRRP